MSPHVLVKSSTHTEHMQFLRDVLHGLSSPQKRIPSKYLYDERGSELFDAICETPEYYVTRTELGIMQAYGDMMAECLGEETMLIEFGSGSSLKTRLLLDHLASPAAYVPVDISEKHLRATARRLQGDYPALEILPVSADFTQVFEAPLPACRPRSRVVYFPGSTIGNFTPEEANGLLSHVRDLVNDTGGGLLIGIDLQKDHRVLHAAYNDAQGVTRQFTRNLLRRLRSDLGARLNPHAFEHHAIYNPRLGRIEIGLLSLAEQTIEVGGQRFRFQEGELVRTEYSYKYSIEGFAKLAEKSGLFVRRVWTDERAYLGVLYLTV